MLIFLTFGLTLSGCAHWSQINRRSVQDLYQEAVAVAQQRSETDRLGDVPGHSPILPAEHFEVSISTGTADESWSLRLTDNPLRLASGTEVERDQISQISPSEVVAAIDIDPDSAGQLLNDSFDQMDLREALILLAESAGQQVVLDDRVSGEVTAEIKNKTFEEALDLLLLPHGLLYGKYKGSYLIVDPVHVDSPLIKHMSRRYHYAPRHHLATKLVELVPKELTKFYQLSDQRNLIVVNAPPAIADEVLTRLQELDQPVPQVILEAIVCVTNPDSGFRFGMDWNHVLSVEGADRLKVGLSGLAFSAAVSKYGAANVFDDFAVTSTFVQLLSQQGYVTIRAQPRVTAKHGEKASISINRETFFSLQPNNSNVLFRQDVQKVDAGITLQLTPKIRGNVVSVEIEKAEVSEDIRSNDSRPELNANPYPIINRRQVSTNVDVADGSTIVLGGLVQRQTVDRISKTPGFASLPMIGHLFRKIEKQEQDTEVAIFISPSIVQPVCH